MTNGYSGSMNQRKQFLFWQPMLMKRIPDSPLMGNGLPIVRMNPANLKFMFSLFLLKKEENGRYRQMVVTHHGGARMVSKYFTFR